MKPRAQAAHLILFAIVLGGLAFRLFLLPLVQNPGINDPAHYFNLGRRLAQGQGFTIDYVWHYSRMPVEIVHATDHWLPLTGVAAAIGMAVGGVHVQAALALFVLAGSLTPLLAYLAARQLEQSRSCALIAAALAAFLPEFVWNSLRTDTTILNLVLIASAFLIFNRAIERQSRIGIALSGALFGLAYLTRNDAIVLVAVLLAFMLLARAKGWTSARRSDLALFVAAFALSIAPWLLRNMYEIGSIGSPQTGRMPFMVEPTDLYAYGLPINLESMLQRQSAGQLLEKRIFELGAALKQMAVALQLPLVFLPPAGAAWLYANNHRKTLLGLAPIFAWIAAILIVYPILMPVHNQGGSFKKLFISILPLLIPLGAIALDKLIQRRALRVALLLASLVWPAWSSYDLVRRETAAADTFYGSMQVLADALAELPDVTGDGEIRLMSQNPYVLSVFGYSSVVTPLANREDTLALARLFEIDYLQMPAARPALDPLYLGVETDPRFQLAAHLADAGAIPFELYRLSPDE